MMSLALIHHYSYDYGKWCGCVTFVLLILGELAGSMILDEGTNGQSFLLWEEVSA